MRYLLTDLPPEADVVTTGALARITLGELVFTAQVVGDALLLFPDRSVKQRDFLKMMGRLVE